MNLDRFYEIGGCVLLPGVFNPYLLFDMKSKLEGLKLIGNLSRSAIRGWELTNTRARGNVEKAIADELKAAKAIAEAMGIDATEVEIEAALNGSL